MDGVDTTADPVAVLGIGVTIGEAVVGVRVTVDPLLKAGVTYVLAVTGTDPSDIVLNWESKSNKTV